MSKLGEQKQFRYSHMAAKWNIQEQRYVPQGVKYMGPKWEDTLALRAEYEAHLGDMNPDFKGDVLWFDKAVDEE